MKKISLKAFRKLSKPEKRVAIAKDVLAQLHSRKMEAKSNSYLKVQHQEKGFLYEIEEKLAGTELQDLLKKNTCKACAIGGCFVSLVSIEDKFKITDEDVFRKDVYLELDQFRGRLLKYFSSFQLGLIESAFEKMDFTECEDMDKASETRREQMEQDVRLAIRFGKKNGNAEKRMTAIMENIIKNKGTFIPYQVN